MRVFDLPRDRSELGRPARIVVIGSRCILGAFDDLASLGKLVTAWESAAIIPHTFGEVRQALRHCLLKQSLSQLVVPFISDQPDAVQPATSALQRLIDDADAFVVEVSELDQLKCGEFYLQRDAFLRRFVAPKGNAALRWYESLLAEEPPNEKLVQSIVALLDHGCSIEERDLTIQILRNTRLEIVDEPLAKSLIEAICLKPSAKWIFVPSFTVAGLDGALMDDRRRLTEILRKATTACGAMMFDPTSLAASIHRPIEGRLEAPNINSYDLELRAAIGEAILSSIERGKMALGSDLIRPHPATIDQAPAKVAENINNHLIELHGRRVIELGEDQSGLYAHYHGLLKSREIVRPDAIEIGTLVTQHLPRFDHYHVARSGLGEVPFVLAALGYDTVAFDGNLRRLEAISAGAASLVDRGVILPGKLQVISSTLLASDGQFELRDRTLAIVTQFILGVSQEEQQSALAQFSKYDALLYDPSVLLRADQSLQASEMFLQQLRAHGFSTVRDYPNARLIYCSKSETQQASFFRSARPKDAAIQISDAEDSLGEMAQTLNTELLAVRRARLTRPGSANVRSHEHHGTLLEGGEIVRRRDVEISNFVARTLPRFRQCHVLNVGLGELGFLLAGLGQATMVLEPDGDRLAAIDDIATHLANKGFLLMANFQSAMEAAVGSTDTLAVATQLGSIQPPQEEQEVLSLLSRYQAVLIEPANFLRERKTGADQEAAIDQLRMLGFSSIRRFPRMQLVYCAKPAVSAQKPRRDSRLVDGTEWDNVRPLVFQRLSVTWDDIKLDQPYAFQWQPENKYRWTLRSFPVPGLPIPQDLSNVQVHPDGLTFPDYGAYYVTGPFGAAKILLIDPSSDDDSRIIAMSEFVANAVFHSGADTHLSYEGTARYPSYPTALQRKLFYSDQPLALWCGDIADVLAFLLHSSGYTSRKLSLKNTNNIGHVFLEVYFPTSGRWLMVDPDFGVMLKHNGVFLSADDVVRLRGDGKVQEIQLVELSSKCFSTIEVNFPTSFTGQFTWKAEHLATARIATHGHYHDVVIARGFMGVVYYAYKFGHAVTTRIRPTVENSSGATLAEIEAQGRRPS